MCKIQTVYTAKYSPASAQICIPRQGALRHFDRNRKITGNRHKFTSMFICASLVHPCTSVACCQTKFQVPLTAIKRHPYSGGQYRHLVKHWKDCLL